METTGYYLTYNSGAGIIGYTGGNTPFLFTKPAVCFPNRKLARRAMQRIRKEFYPNIIHRVARRFAIVEASDESYVSIIKNVQK